MDVTPGIRAKIERANLHLHELKKEAEAFFESKPYKVVTELDAKKVEYVLSAQVERSLPVALGVILGDYVHNLRSALDHLITGLVLLNGEVPDRKNEFPIYESEALFEARVLRPRSRGKSSALRGVSDEAVAIITGCQPYQPAPVAGEVSVLSVLHQLSNVD